MGSNWAYWRSRDNKGQSTMAPSQSQHSQIPPSRQYPYTGDTPECSLQEVYRCFPQQNSIKAIVERELQHLKTVLLFSILLIGFVSLIAVLLFLPLLLFTQFSWKTLRDCWRTGRIGTPRYSESDAWLSDRVFHTSGFKTGWNSIPLTERKSSFWKATCWPHQQKMSSHVFLCFVNNA